MEYILYKKLETKVRGDPSDESESTSYVETIILVPVDKEEEFNEIMADDYGYQDYNYKVNYKKIGVFDEEQLLSLKQQIESELVREKL